jgi:release factor glutamine methyltransferase
MLTVLDSIKLSTDYLEKKGIESPRINAELLLAHILSCKRLDLYLSFDRPLGDDEVLIYRTFLKRRGEYEPLQYIIGSVEFYGLPFKVDPSVLIPRPETEILVEEIINNSKKKNDLKILDIGTGSGNIAVSLAHHIPDAKIIGTDISKESLLLASENSSINKTENQVQFILDDILLNELKENEFDLIVSNPPYISKEDFKDLPPELKVYEPKHALTDDANGLFYYKQIAVKAKILLKKNGSVYFEVGKGQSGEVKKILEENNFSEIMIKNDYLNIERVIRGKLN